MSSLRGSKTESGLALEKYLALVSLLLSVEMPSHQLFTELAPRPIQSITRNVCLFVSLPPLSATGTNRELETSGQRVCH